MDFHVLCYVNIIVSKIIAISRVINFSFRFPCLFSEYKPNSQVEIPLFRTEEGRYLATSKRVTLNCLCLNFATIGIV